ncbi:MAG: hypothetical protein LBS43_01175 [Prevotellaceae bacterium]|jgi:hypothetical protein|nr:hypothetical protein [Prevotellaceae bacterium]
MKKIFKLLTMSIAAAFMFTSCAEDAIDDLSGKYPLPDDYALSNLLAKDVQKNTATRTVTIAIGTSGLSAIDNGTGNYLYLKLLIKRTEYFLGGGAYTVAYDTEAKAGNYIQGKDNVGSYWVDVAGGAEVKRLGIYEGTLYVTQNGDNYTIRGTVLLEDRSMVSINYTGLIVFEADPPAFTYALEIETPAMGGGMTPAPIANSRMNKITVFSEGLQMAYFEVVTADDATSLTGSYVVTDGLSATGQANNGYYMDLSGYGLGIMKGGSYYIDGTDEMFIRAGGGNIDITDNNGMLTFTGTNLPIQDISTGMAFGILPTPGSVDYQDAMCEYILPNLLSATATDLAAVSGGTLTGYTVTLKLGETGVTATPNAFGGLDITGTGQYISIDFSRDAANLPAGTYNIVDNASAAVGDAIAGYLLDLGFFQMNSGCLWGSIEADVPAPETFITGGTVVVAESGGVYTITVNATTAGGEVVKAVYTGAITI